jgi:hypothetical protein
MTLRDDEEMQTIIGAVSQMMTSMIGPANELIRSSMGAMTEGVIDAHHRMVTAGIPDSAIPDILIAMVGGSRQAIDKVGKGLTK